MPDSKEKSFSEKFNTWIQTIGIIIGSIIISFWGVYTFYYEKVWLPQSAPVNISINFTLKKAGMNYINDDRRRTKLIAIEMKVSATNPSSRQIYLFPSAFIVHGCKVRSSSLKNSDFFKGICDISICSDSNIYEIRHSDISGSSVVAIGNLIDDKELRPGELVTKTFIFHIPLREYDVLKAYAAIPISKKNTDANKINLTWTFDKNEINNNFGGLVAHGISDAKIEVCSTTSMASLWE